MNTDIRISVDFFAHYKTMRVTRKLGGDGVVALIKLFCYAGKFRSGGILKGMGAEDIADAVGWLGEAEEFVGSLCDIGFLELCEEGIYSIHDWEEHNPWAAGAAERSEAASKAGKASAAKRAKNVTDVQLGVGDSSTDVQLGVGDSSTDVQLGVGDQFNGNPTPSPYPYPYPSPKEVRTTLKAFCAEPQRDEVQAPSKSECSAIHGIVDEKPKPRAKASLDLDGLPQDLRRDVILAFVESRKALRKPLTQRALLMCCKDAMRCQELHGIDPNDAMEKAIGKGWMTCDPEYFSSQKKQAKPSTGSDKHGGFSEKDYGTGGLI